MSNEDYVSIEVAKKLQEKGYRESCYATYLMEFKDEFTLSIGTYKKTEFEDLLHIPSKDMRLQYLAPTLYEAQKWLREKHEIHLITKCVCFHKLTHHHDYICEVYSLGSKREYKEGYIRYTYEEALNAGILAALELI